MESKVELQLPPDKAEWLYLTAKLGTLEEFDVLDAKFVETTPSFMGPNEEKSRSHVEPGVDQALKKKILIVQGDWEGGMALLALDLKDAGHDVGKVMFCAPDLVYRLRGIRTHVFRKTLASFDDWLRELVRRDGYNTFFLYNRFRPYNLVAWLLAEELNLDCHVFDSGLVGPNCVMVFDRNNMPLQVVSREWGKLLNGEREAPVAPEIPPELSLYSPSAKMIAFCSNFLLSRITSPLFPNFVDIRDMKLWRHLKHGIIHIWRFFERNSDEELEPVFADELSGKYYVVPLQAHNDTQITQCSDFRSIEQFINHVVHSFARYAPPETKLVFKVNPLDRGYKDYTDLIAGLDHRLGGDRLIYIDRVYLPILLNSSRGVVCINGPEGVSGLLHQAPVITLGVAVYDLPNLTFQGSLDAFWTEAVAPERHQIQNFFNLMLESNQGLGTFSQRCFDVPGWCRIQWPAPFQKKFFQRGSEALMRPITAVQSSGRQAKIGSKL